MDDDLIDKIDIDISDEDRRVIKEMPIETKIALLKLRANLSDNVDSTFIRLLF